MNQSTKINSKENANKTVSTASETKVKTENVCVPNDDKSTTNTQIVASSSGSWFEYLASWLEWLSPESNTPLVEPWKQFLGPEGTSEPPIQLHLRAPDSQLHSVTFPAGTKLQALLLYIVTKLGLDSDTFELHRQFPKKCLTECYPMASLESLGVRTRDTLYIRSK